MGNYVYTMLERINTYFLLRELTSVMHQIIENKVNNVSFYKTPNSGANVERVLKMDQIMNHVRYECLQWTQMVTRLGGDSEELETTLSKILLYLFETPFNCTMYHICCLYTFIADVSVVKIQRNKPVNLSQIYKVLHDSIIEKGGHVSCNELGIVCIRNT